VVNNSTRLNRMAGNCLSCVAACVSGRCSRHMSSWMSVSRSVNDDDCLGFNKTGTVLLDLHLLLLL
jgi:hypothetical protein